MVGLRSHRKEVGRFGRHLASQRTEGNRSGSLTSLMGSMRWFLAEDAPKFIGKGEFGQNISASRQIYLTFSADNTFTEEDVSNYFNTFGSVEDVRIPCQQRRMFGFVTFVDPETVKMILEKGKSSLCSWVSDA